MRKTTLPEHISTVGDGSFAAMMGIARRTACKWRLRESHPSYKQAWVIVRKTGVDYEGIYGEHAAIRHNYFE